MSTSSIERGKPVKQTPRRRAVAGEESKSELERDTKRKNREFMRDCYGKLKLKFKTFLTEALHEDF